MINSKIRGIFIFNLLLVILLILAYYHFFNYTGKAISSVNHEHINTFAYLLGVSGEIDNSEIQWISQKYDLVVGQIGSAKTLKQYNPNIKFCSGRPLEYMWTYDYANLQTWGEQNNRDWENAFLHYQEDVFVPFENKIVSKDSRVANGMPNPKSQEWLDWATNDIVTCSGWLSGDDCIYDCIWEDNAIYLPTGTYEQGYFGEGKTYTYYNVFPIINGQPDYTHPFIEDRLIAGENLANRVSSASGRNIFAIPNVGASWPFMASSLPYTDLLTEHFDHILVEWWLLDTSGTKKPSYQASYDKEILQALDISKSGTKLFLQTPTFLPYLTDERKMLSLSTFYLINNPNLYYSFIVYSSSDYPDSIRGKQHPSVFLWFNAIDYDIGSPIVNSHGKVDYAAKSNSNEHFIFASGQDPSNSADTYYVLAREYENALILVKLKPREQSSIDTNSITTHNLGGDFKLLNVDGTLGSTISSISLKNNGAAILIKESEEIDINETEDEINITEEEISTVINETTQEVEETANTQEEIRQPQENFIPLLKKLNRVDYMILGVSIFFILILIFIIVRKTRNIY